MIIILQKARDILVRTTIARRTIWEYIHVLQNGGAPLQRKVRPMNTTKLHRVAGYGLQRSQRITIYPNLVSQKKFWIQLYYVEKCVFSVHLYTLNGQEVFRKFFHHSSLHGTHAVQLPLRFVRGIYKMAIKSERLSTMQPLVVQ